MPTVAKLYEHGVMVRMIPITDGNPPPRITTPRISPPRFEPYEAEVDTTRPTSLLVTDDWERGLAHSVEKWTVDRWVNAFANWPAARFVDPATYELDVLVVRYDHLRRSTT
jgi:hypothetical protein